MNDIKFLEKYNESAIDNFVAVVKQNILFQAQISYLNEQNNEQNKLVPELKKQIADFESVKESLVKLREENVNLTNELNSKNNIIENASKSDAEKYRLQTSVNEQSREIEKLTSSLSSLRDDLNKKINALNDELNQKKEYIAKLEEMLPKTAKKKLGINLETTALEETKEESIDNETVKVLSSGGSF